MTPITILVLNFLDKLFPFMPHVLNVSNPWLQKCILKHISSFTITKIKSMVVTVMKQHNARFCILKKEKKN